LVERKPAMRVSTRLVLFAFAASTCSYTWAAKDTGNKYMGVAKCKKCHADEKLGNQYGKWKKMKHAKAYELLGSDKAKEVAKKAGITEDPQKSPKCLKCHTTGHDLPASRFGTLFKVKDGVQCEACHGPGRAYAKKSVMKNLKKAKSKGLTDKPTEETCRSCHNADSPTWNPEHDTTKDGKKVGFDFEERYKEIKHPRPKKEGEAKE